MTTKLFSIAVFLVFSFSFAQVKKGAAFAPNCCDGKSIAMTDPTVASMQDPNMLKEEHSKKEDYIKKDDEKVKTEYTCPMHPEIKSDKPGTCPKCKMDLVKVKKETKIIQTVYTCPMHPDVKSEAPGKCPKCGMSLVQDKKEETSLMKQKMKAMMAGKYNCCLEEPCDECLKAHGSCSCKNAVKNDKPVCNECYDGWQHGKGAVSGKSAKDIKKGHEHKH